VINHFAEGHKAFKMTSINTKNYFPNVFKIINGFEMCSNIMIHFKHNCISVKLILENISNDIIKTVCTSSFWDFWFVWQYWDLNSGHSTT
jgi:hypothetical protein